MESIEVELEGQKQDERGRQLRSREDWANLVAVYEQSGRQKGRQKGAPERGQTLKVNVRAKC